METDLGNVYGVHKALKPTSTSEESDEEKVLHVNT